MTGQPLADMAGIVTGAGRGTGGAIARELARNGTGDVVAGVARIRRFTDKSGQPLVLLAFGSAKQERTPPDADQIGGGVAAGWKRLDFAETGEADLARLAPFARPGDLDAMWCAGSDLYLQPAQLPLGYAQTAEALGAFVRPFAPVTSIAEMDGSVAGVVVDAAGAWAPRVAAEAGLAIPLQPVRHQLMVTGSFPAWPKAIRSVGSSTSTSLSAPMGAASGSAATRLTRWRPTSGPSVPGSG